MELLTRVEQSSRLRAVAVVSTLALGASACGDTEESRPSALFDGSPATQLPVVLEGVDTPVLRTRTMVERSVPGSERRNSCLGSWSDRHHLSRTSVARVGVSGETVTLRDASRTAVLGCDNGAGAREGDRRWCGAAYGRHQGTRLLDPRLSLLCTDADGDPLAFAWIVPSARTRFVVVRQDGYAEAYERVGSLPVRIASSTGIDLATSSATIDVSEHDRDGALLRRYSMKARVAG